jgi:hypothetical protein
VAAVLQARSHLAVAFTRKRRFLQVSADQLQKSLIRIDWLRTSLVALINPIPCAKKTRAFYGGIREVDRNLSPFHKVNLVIRIHYERELKK